MEVENKKYTLQDYIKINWEISRLWVVVRAMDKVIRGSLPSLQILATASFVNTALSVFNGHKESKAIPSFCRKILSVTAYFFKNLYAENRL